MITQPIRMLSPVTLLITALMLACVLIAPKAFAQNLTEANVRAFLDSLQAAEPVLREHEDELDEFEDGAETTDLSAIFSSGLEQMKGHAMLKDIEKVTKRHGFSDIEQWAQTGDQVFQAWFALEMEAQGPAAQQEMQRALAEIDNNPHMTEEQKAQMRAMMGTAMNTMNAAKDVPDDAKRAVRPFMDELRAMSEDEDSGW
ncbi:hypothetical protein [Marinobacter halophilus]|uniref:Uncharacterized protein n=1 Tax=Marinobacter halophilus TaxID=1323740 RepID=A0A2T1KJ44_9GAMM|nr:hypothetical protein [Marinobacter halophilus]PSF10161.1 hypothetical protein C7H08_01260 [Marinobacter halophilus]GGC68251.1 hypothetical protein GCM10011362_15960 [Marinobacter halophilus]